MKKLLTFALMALLVLTIPAKTKADTIDPAKTETRKAEATYLGNYKFQTDDGHIWKYKSKGFVKNVRYNITFLTKGTRKVKDDIIKKKPSLTQSMQAVKKCSKGSKTAMQKCAKQEKTIKYFLKQNFSEEIKMIKGGDSQWKTLDKRAEYDRIYITYEDGVVLNKNKDGKSYYFKKPYNYIGYRGVKGIRKGSVVRTYFIWCTDCNEPDDIIARWDVVIKK